MFVRTRLGELPAAWARLPQTPRRRGGLRNRTDKPVRNLGKVLLLGRIRELALYRSEYLQAKGFEVIAPPNHTAAMETIRHGGFDVAVITYTLPNVLALEYAEMVRQYCTSCPVVVITDNDLGDRHVAPDAIVLADDGPEGLLRALYKLTDGHNR